MSDRPLKQHDPSWDIFLKPKPSHEDIARLAYAYWEMAKECKTSQRNSAVENWLWAEKYLTENPSLFRYALRVFGKSKQSLIESRELDQKRAAYIKETNKKLDQDSEKRMCPHCKRPAGGFFQ